LVIPFLSVEHTLIVAQFLQAPLMTIAANAGVDGSVVVGKLLEQDNLSLGYDAAKGLC
jgi:chaperonin GroEL